MGLRKFGNSHTVEDSYELPWIEEYVKVTGDTEAIQPIYFIVCSAKGTMVYTHAYKAHIKPQRSMHADLEEALPAFVKAGIAVPMLFCTADKSRRPVIMQDDEKLCHRWHKVENRFVQIMGKGKRVPSSEARANPLLACLEGDSSVAETASAANADALQGKRAAQVGKTD